MVLSYSVPAVVDAVSYVCSGRDACITSKTLPARVICWLDAFEWLPAEQSVTVHFAMQVVWAGFKCTGRHIKCTHKMR